MIITKKEVQQLKALKNGEEFLVWVDFGLTRLKCRRDNDKISFENKLILDLNDKLKENFCYLIDKEGAKPIAFFSEETNTFYKLIATPDWPSLAIGSVPMHQVKSPLKDTEHKIEFLRPYGLVLDTCLGLGYTAIASSKTSGKIITFEKDENVIFLCQINPLSQEVFSSSKIEIKRKDVAIGIKEFKNNYFDCIIHDPPTFKLAPELFSETFYRELFRVLREGGKMFHYTPLYKIKHQFDFPRRIKDKLKKVGFKVVSYSDEAFGWLCKK